MYVYMYPQLVYDSLKYIALGYEKHIIEKVAKPR